MSFPFLPSSAPAWRALRQAACCAGLGVAATAALPPLAAGAQQEVPLQLQGTPRLSDVIPEGKQAPAFASGDQISGRSGLETVISGNAELRRPDISIHANKITFDQTTDTVELEGAVRIDDRGNRYTATSGQLQLDSSEGFLLQPTYHFLAGGGHGEAKRFNFVDPTRSVAIDGTYTTCPRPGPDWVPDWILHAARLNIDREEDVAVAKRPVLDFKGVPILALPAMTFSLTGARRSGWLPATFGFDNKNGLTLTAPYYWNIAPNRDYTFTPTVMQRRGVNLGNDFRYLESNYKGEIRADYMPKDTLRHRDRWAVFTQHSGTYTGIPLIRGFGASLNINRVSDNNYWNDFAGLFSASQTRALGLNTSQTLASTGGLSWGAGNFSLGVLAQKWQTLQPTGSALIVPPYDRLPQVMARWGRYNDHGFDYSLRGDFSRFHADSALTHQPNADRAFAIAQVSRPFIRPWGFFTPAVKLDTTYYRFNNPIANGKDTASRTLPTASLDGGLVFERDTAYFGRGFTQTLEPRVKYIYTPYKNQSAIPNYDSGVYDFNFATIWSDNAFAGNDRIADNNAITTGLTSRLLDPATGAEALRLSIAQRYRFQPQKVTLPGGVPDKQGWTDTMLGAGVHLSNAWSLENTVAYNIKARQSNRDTLNLRYMPRSLHTFNLAYRYQRTGPKSKSIDVGWQWPLADLLPWRKELGSSRPAGGSCHGRWYSVGRMNYSLQDHQLTDAIAGFEYDAGCWVGRIVFEKLETGVSTATKRVLFQLELVGLGGLGTSPLQTLRDNIRGYETLHQSTPPAPSRYQDYE